MFILSISNFMLDSVKTVIAWLLSWIYLYTCNQYFQDVFYFVSFSWHFDSHILGQGMQFVLDNEQLGIIFLTQDFELLLRLVDLCPGLSFGLLGDLLQLMVHL